MKKDYPDTAVGIIFNKGKKISVIYKSILTPKLWVPLNGIVERYE